MKLLPILGTLVVVGMTSTPAFALFCTDEGPSAGIDYEFNSGGGFRIDDSDFQKDFDISRLRDIGVYAKSVERWNGCIRAFVDNGNGGQTMEFYDPATLRRLQ
ncbi:hypothetical protein ABIB57_004558 [Devosia sp. UYZn731]|uniref:hypothetical protein n=1 Tax=Devosia sp. UYZn731 TaxID=3156345 RepID=UPI00339774DF